MAAGWKEYALEAGHHGQEVHLGAVPALAEFEMEVRDVRGSAEFIVGVLAVGDESDTWQSVLSNNRGAFCVVGALNATASWYRVSQQLPLLLCEDINRGSDAVVSVSWRQGRATFALTRDGREVASCFEPLAHGSYSPCVLRCWSDTFMQVRRRVTGIGQETLGEQLYRDRRFTDAVLAAHDGGHTEEVKVHRSVLAGASAVFERMLASRMSEGCESRVDVGELAPEVLHAFVRYIYTRGLPDVPRGRCRTLSELFALGCRYMMRPLVWDAGQRLLEALDPGSVVETSKVIRLQTRACNEDAEHLWERLLERLRGDAALSRAFAEGLLDDLSSPGSSCYSPRASTAACGRAPA